MLKSCPTVSSLIIEQEAAGYRFATEPFLLAAFADLAAGSKVLDIGTGCGVIALLLAAKEPRVHCTALEIQTRLADLAAKNVERNGLGATIQVVRGDFAKTRTRWNRESFDLIVSNPPFRKKNSGRTNPNPEKAIARHELTLDLETLAAQSALLLKENGKLALAYPIQRLREVSRQLEHNRLFPNRIRRVFGRRGADPKIFLIEAIKGGTRQCMEEPPLYIYNSDGFFTPEMRDIYGSFNYTGWPHGVRKN